jgi:hypothetical protein
MKSCDLVVSPLACVLFGPSFLYSCQRHWSFRLIRSSQTSETKPTSEVSAARAEARIGIFPLPLTPLERFLVKSDTRRSSMVIRVVLRFTGEHHAETLIDTLQKAIQRHPLLTCRLSNRRFFSYWVAGTQERIATQHIQGSVFSADSGPFTKRIDLTQSGGLQTEIRFMDDGVKVILDAHHAVTDGNGLRQVVTDWLHLYHCEILGLPTRLPVIDPDRLQQRDRFPQPVTATPITFREAVRNFLCTVQGRTARWVSASSHRIRNQTAAHGYCVEHFFSTAEIEQVEKRLSAWRVTLNELVLVACMSTFARLAPGGSHGDRITILNPTDLRLPSDRSMPATNRFGFAFVRRIRSDCHTPVGLLKGIHEELDYVRKGYIGVEFIKGLKNASGIPGGVDLIRRLGLFVPSLQWTCLGDVTRGAKRLMIWKDGVLHAGGLRLESATGFAPFAENVPLSVATCEAGKRIALTLRSSTEFISPEQTRDFLEVLVSQICTMELPEGVV